MITLMSRKMIALTSLLGALASMPAPALGASTAVMVQALRMSGKITCGAMPTTDPAFQTMLTKLSASPPDYLGAATAAVQSPYFPKCLVRRMARQMMSPAMSEVGIPDNDATTFLVANLIGTSGQTPTVGKLWSENATYLIHVTGASCKAIGDANCATGGSAPSGAPKSTGPYCHTMDLTPAQLEAVDWQTDLVAVPNQQCALNFDKTKGKTQVFTAIPPTSAAGFLTLSDRINDNSYAMYAFLMGTNLRGVENMYEIATGFDIPSMETNLSPPLTTLETDAPAFVPAGDPNFTTPVTQTACLACHGGGVSSLTHGYAAVADLFDYQNKKGLGFGFFPTLATANNRKSNGSSTQIRNLVTKCTTSNYTTNDCNPFSSGVDDKTFSWDLHDFSPVSSGQWQWNGPVSGQGYNALGQALGQAGIVYKYMTQRVVGEICPSQPALTDQTISQIAAQAQANDSFPYIVEAVASNPACL